MRPTSPHSRAWHTLRPCALALLAAISVPGTRPLQAQPAPSRSATAIPGVNSLVRVTLPPDLRGRRQTREATVLASSPDSLRLAWRAGDTASLAVVEMHRLELGLGPHRPIAASAAWGALVGGVGLTVRTFATAEDGFWFSRSEIAAAAGLVGALGGAAIGAVVGTLRTSERWRTVYRAGAAMTPVLGRERGVQLRIAF